MGYSPWGHKESDMTERLFTLIPWVGKIPWRREWQPTPVLLPEEFHGQDLGGLQSMGHKESYTTE